MTIDELNAKYGKPATVVNNTTNNNPFGWTTTPEASKPDNIITSLLHGKSKTPEQPKQDNALNQILHGGQKSNIEQNTQNKNTIQENALSTVVKKGVNALPAIGGIVGGIGGAAVGTFAGPVGTYTGGVGGSAAGGAIGEALKEKITGQKLSAKNIAREGIVMGVTDAVGGPIIKGVSRVLTNGSKMLYDAAIPMSEKEAAQTINYRANNSFWDRFFGKVESPNTTSNTAFNKSFIGTPSTIAVQAKQEGKNLFENIVGPEIDNSKVVVPKDDFFKMIEEKIIKDHPNDLTQQKSILEGLDSVKEDYGSVKDFTLRQLQDLKSDLTHNVPVKYYKGKDISGIMPNIRAEMSDTARDIVRSNISGEAKQAFDDYGNLLNLQQLGIKDLAGSKFKAGAGSFIMGIKDMVVTPIATIGGQVIYRTANGLEFTGPAGAKTLAHVLGFDDTNNNSTNPY